MEKNIKVYIDLESIYSKSNQTYNEDYMNICIQFTKIADLVVVHSDVIEFKEVIKHLNNRIKNVNFLACDSIENIVLDEPNQKAVLVISSIYTEVKIIRNIIKLSLDFDFVHNKFLNTSFVEAAKEKLIYNLFSDDFSFLINKDTMKEFEFIQSVLQKNNLCSGKILDCCCGVGRHDILLSNQGYEILGIDISQSQIATAKRTNKNNLVDYIVGDIRNYKPHYEQFDAAICMWTSFNYLSRKEMDVFFDNIYNGLKNNSIFILDTKNFISPIEYKLYSKELVKGTKKVHIFVIKRVKNKIQTSKYIYFIYDIINRQTEFFVDNEIINIYTKEDILDMAQNKFTIIKVYGDYDATPYDEKKSDRMILVLRKL